MVDEAVAALRVIAGTAGGRRLVAPKGDHTRPTTDRVKESVLGALHMELPGSRVLDLYAGSGGLGIEALSRGAAHVTFVERHRKAVEVIRTNLESCRFQDLATILQDDIATALTGPPDEPFDIVLCDPPYDRSDDDLAEILDLLVPWLADPARIRIEQDKRSEAPRWPAAIQPGRVRRYGDTAIHEATHTRTDP